MVDYKELCHNLIEACNEATATLTEVQKKAAQLYMDKCHSGEEKFDPEFFDMITRFMSKDKKID